MNETTTDGNNTYIWTQETDGLVNLNGESIVENYVSSQTINLLDYNDSSYMNITKWAYDGTSGAEWICFEGCEDENITFDQSMEYDVTDFCDPSNGNCNIKLKVNWSLVGTVVNANRYYWARYNNANRVSVYYITLCYNGACKFTSKYGLSGTFAGVDYFGDTKGTGTVSESILHADYTYYGDSPYKYYQKGAKCYAAASTSTAVVTTFSSTCSLVYTHATGYRQSTANDNTTRWMWYPSANCYVSRASMYVDSSCTNVTS